MPAGAPGCRIHELKTTQRGGLLGGKRIRPGEVHPSRNEVDGPAARYVVVGVVRCADQDSCRLTGVNHTHLGNGVASRVAGIGTDELGRVDVSGNGTQRDGSGQIGAAGARCSVKQSRLALAQECRAAPIARRADQNVADVDAAVGGAVEVAARGNREPGLTAPRGAGDGGAGHIAGTASPGEVGKADERYSVNNRPQTGKVRSAVHEISRAGTIRRVGGTDQERRRLYPSSRSRCRRRPPKSLPCRPRPRRRSRSFERSEASKRRRDSRR